MTARFKMTTHGGKEVELRVDTRSSLYKFQFTSGGELPVELQGLFTEEKYAKQALTRYLDRTQDRATAKSRKAV